MAIGFRPRLESKYVVRYVKLAESSIENLQAHDKDSGDERTAGDSGP